MNMNDYLKNNQPIIYKTFVNGLKLNKIHQGYLLVGDSGAPLMETALFLAQSLVCEHDDPLACQECLTCQRIKDNAYSDFYLLDGHNQNIKVGDIEALQSFFARTPIEKAGKMIYIINELENSNQESLNALLKFLEEPNENVYCFIITHNLNALLPTIISRLEILTLLPLKKDVLIKEGEENGVSKDDCEIIANFSSSLEELLKINNDKSYLQIKDSVFDFLNALDKDYYSANYLLEKDIIPILKDKPAIRLFLDILSLCFLDMIKLDNQIPITLTMQNSLLQSLKSKLKHIEDSYIELMNAKSKLEININTGLLLEHLAFVIEGD